MIRADAQGVAEPADIDLAIKTALGYPMGPMELLDLVGLEPSGQPRLCHVVCSFPPGLAAESYSVWGPEGARGPTERIGPRRSKRMRRPASK